MQVTFGTIFEAHVAQLFVAKVSYRTSPSHRAPFPLPRNICTRVFDLLLAAMISYPGEETGTLAGAGVPPIDRRTHARYIHANVYNLPSRYP
jgi:hypothetical protein